MIDSFAQQVGWKPVILDSFKTFDQAPIYHPQLDAMRASGAVPMITWEPQTSSEGRITLAKIARRRYDGYSPSSPDGGGLGQADDDPLRPGDERLLVPVVAGLRQLGPLLRQAWRHIVRVFRREGANNVKWVWTPYVETDNNLPFRRFYPGDATSTGPASTATTGAVKFAWKSFRELFARSYRRACSDSPRGR